MRLDVSRLVIPLAIMFVIIACDSSPTNKDPSPVASQPTASETYAENAPVVGIKVDQFGTGYLDIANYRYSGLDAEIAKYVYQGLFNRDDPYFLPVSSQTREGALSDGAVRFFTATFTMTSERATKFDLAGPYLLTKQGVMVTKDRYDIQTLDDLKGKKVCVNTGGALPGKILQEKVPKAIQVIKQTYGECLKTLRTGDADAFSTDLAILYGYAGHRDNFDLKVLPDITVEDNIMYGVAFRKSDHDLCLKAKELIKETIREGIWDNHFSNTLPKYKKDYPNYQTAIRPTEGMIETNSCQTPS